MPPQRLLAAGLPAQFLVAGALLAFLTPQGLGPVPGTGLEDTLRPSLEGVETGLEEQLKPSLASAGLEERTTPEDADRFFRVMALLGYGTDDAVAEALVAAGYTGEGRQGPRGGGLSREAVNPWRNRKFSMPREALALLPQIPRAAGLEEKEVAMGVAVGEAAAMEGGRAVVVDASVLSPEAAPVFAQFSRFAPRTVILGPSALADALAKRNPRLLRVAEPSADAVTAALSTLPDLAQVTYLGDPENAPPVRVAAAVLNVGLEEQPFSLEAILRAFRVSAEMAATLAAGLEEAVGLGREA